MRDLEAAENFALTPPEPEDDPFESMDADDFATICYEYIACNRSVYDDMIEWYLTNQRKASRHDY